MTGFGSLVRMYLRDLSRRKLFWGLFFLTVGVIAVNYGTTRMVEDAVSQGETWDIATKRAASQLEGLMSWVRPWVGFVVVLLAAQVAPESRKNGTTQFVLSLGVRRRVLAAAQFAALAIVLLVGLLILHAGLAIAGAKTNFMKPAEVGFAWATLALSAMTAAASVFSLSLTASAFETYAVFLGIPFLCRTIPETLRGLPKHFPMPLVRIVDNVQLFFPRFDEVVTWPHLTFGAQAPTPVPQWHWRTAQLASATLFWVVLGLWLQRRHDFGSRTALK